MATFFPEKSTIIHKVTPTPLAIDIPACGGVMRSLRLWSVSEDVIKVGFDSQPHMPVPPCVVCELALPPDVGHINVAGLGGGELFITVGRQI